MQHKRRDGQWPVGVMPDSSGHQNVKGSVGKVGAARHQLAPCEISRRQAGGRWAWVGGEDSCARLVRCETAPVSIWVKAWFAVSSPQCFGP